MLLFSYPLATTYLRPSGKVAKSFAKCNDDTRKAAYCKPSSAVQKSHIECTWLWQACATYPTTPSSTLQVNVTHRQLDQHKDRLCASGSWFTFNAVKPRGLASSLLRPDSTSQDCVGPFETLESINKAYITVNYPEGCKSVSDVLASGSSFCYAWGMWFLGSGLAANARTVTRKTLRMQSKPCCVFCCLAKDDTDYMFEVLT